MQFISDKTLSEIEDALGLNLADEDKRSEMMKKVTTLISGRAGIRIVKGFSDDEAREFNDIPEEDLEKMERYILAKNPDALAIFEDEAQKIKQELLSTESL